MADQQRAQLSRGLTVLMTGVGLTIAVLGIRSIPSVGALLLSMVLVVIAWPVAGALRKRGAPSWLSLVGLLAAVYGIFVAMIVSIVWALYGAVSYVATSDYSERLQDLESWAVDVADRFGISEQEVANAVASIDLSALGQQLLSVFSGLLGVASVLGVVLAISLFMAMDAGGFVDRLDDSTAAERPHIYGALREFAAQTRSYYFVSTVFGAIVSFLNAIVLVSLGVPMVLTWSVLSFITNYIPNIGFIIGLIPAALVAYLDEGPTTAIIVVIAYTVINVVIQTIIQPKIVGDAMGLSATITFISLIFWAFVIGPIGTLIAVPLTLLTKALLIDIDPDLDWLRPLISLNADEPPDAAELDADQNDVDDHKAEVSDQGGEIVGVGTSRQLPETSDESSTPS